MARREELTNEQWTLIEPLFDKTDTIQTRGRPPRPAREILNGVLWILRSGARWSDLSERFPPYQTCHRRFQQWVRDGRLKKVLETLAEDLRTRGKLDLSETSIDGTFASAKKGASRLEKPSGASKRERVSDDNLSGGRFAADFYYAGRRGNFERDRKKH